MESNRIAKYKHLNKIKDQKIKVAIQRKEYGKIQLRQDLLI